MVQALSVFHRCSPTHVLFTGSDAPSSCVNVPHAVRLPRMLVRTSRHASVLCVGALVAGAAIGCNDYTCYDTATCPLLDAGVATNSRGADGSVYHVDSSTDLVAGDLGDAAVTSDYVDTGLSSQQGVLDRSSEEARPSSETSDVVSSALPLAPTGTESVAGEYETSEATSASSNTAGERHTSQSHSGSSPAEESGMVNDESTSGQEGVSGPDLDPEGYWRQDDWEGCVWTGIDEENAGTSISPQDFTSGAADGYCVAGNVAATEGWMGVALLGFNLNQDPRTAACEYVPMDAHAEGPPAVTVTKQGLAVNFVKRGVDVAFTLRVQIRGPNGASDPNDRWCANIDETQGKKLIDWNDFNTECWDGGDGADYQGEPISAIAFLVPGNGWAEGDLDSAPDTPFDFCIKGIAAGDSADEAPGGDTALSGLIGGTAAGADFERVKVSAGGKSYLIQNNNWGNIAGAQTISFVNNSFTVTDGPDGSASCQGCPLSFPSIYIGASGDTDGAKFHTRSTDNLPAIISDITFLASSVRWSGSPGSGASASYDLWFAKSSRGDLTNKRYNDALDGAIMLWLHDPPNAQPIGSDVADVTINGINWDVWVGPRGQGPSSAGADLLADVSAPVISYVAKTSTNTFNGDLVPFLEDAPTRSIPFTSGLLLTDVFFGFEIWNGGVGLKVDDFEVDVQK